MGVTLDYLIHMCYIFHHEISIIHQAICQQRSSTNTKEEERKNQDRDPEAIRESQAKRCEEIERERGRLSDPDI